jgi:hypothetical protein
MSILDALIVEARRRFGAVTPPMRLSWYRAMTSYGALKMLWFNSQDHSTHVICAVVENKNLVFIEPHKARDYMLKRKTVGAHK